MKTRLAALALAGLPTLLFGLALPHPAAPSSLAKAPEVSASALIGQVVTATITITNTGLPANTAFLFEGLAPTTPLVAPLRVPLPQTPGPLAPHLQNAFKQAESVNMIWYLNDQADLSAALTMWDWGARGAWVVNTLQREAQRAQAPLLAALHRRGLAYQSFWIVNALAVRGDLSLAQWAASQPEIALVDLDVAHVLEAEPPTEIAAPTSVAWGVDKIGAPTVWNEWGARGAGIVVANIDTGVAYSHPALLTHYRGWSPNGVEHDYAWFDPALQPPSPIPDDFVGHGTHTLGTIAGGSAGGFDALGVAPEATWITARGCEGLLCSDSHLIAAAQWMLAPTRLDGTHPRPDLRPHILSNSWTKSGDDPWFTGYVAAWNAAGIFSVFANGNTGLNGCGSAGAPANYAQALGIGATEANDLIAVFSSRGPGPNGRLKPEVTAPGVNIPSAWPDGSVMNSSGTSMATPHVAGVVALLWSANPSLIGDLDTTKNILQQTARPLSTTECSVVPATAPNNVYGWGRVDALKAVQAARVDVAWLSLPPTITLPAEGAAMVTLTLDARQVPTPGLYTARVLAIRQNILTSELVTFTVLPAPNTAQITGQLTDQWTGAGVYGKLQLNTGSAFRTDLTGHYTLTLAYGAYPMTASATGYLSQSASISLSANLQWPFTLTADLPHMAFAPAPISATLAFGGRADFPQTITNLGPQPLTVAISVPTQEWQIESQTPFTGALFDLRHVRPLDLGDDVVLTMPFTLPFSAPIFGALTNRVYVSSNGWVSARYQTNAAAWAVCLPWGSLPPGTVAPFWADLDPSQGGAIKAGAVNSGTFVVSYEAVPPWEANPSPTAPTYTFQVAFYATGKIQFLYGAMGPMPSKWAVGFSNSETRGQNLACAQRPQPLAFYQWTTRNQPDAAVWLSALPTHITVPSGASETVTVMVRGFGSAPWYRDPFLGTILLNTNDPGQATRQLSAQATIDLAPYQLFGSVVGR